MHGSGTDVAFNESIPNLEKKLLLLHIAFSALLYRQDPKINFNQLCLIEKYLHEKIKIYIRVHGALVDAVVP